MKLISTVTEHIQDLSNVEFLLGNFEPKYWMLIAYVATKHV